MACLYEHSRANVECFSSISLTATLVGTIYCTSVYVRVVLLHTEAWGHLDVEGIPSRSRFPSRSTFWDMRTNAGYELDPKLAHEARWPCKVWSPLVSSAQGHIVGANADDGDLGHLLAEGRPVHCRLVQRPGRVLPHGGMQASVASSCLNRSA